jgi:hypothetical protein
MTPELCLINRETPMGSDGAGRALCESNSMAQTNTESIRLWSCAAQCPYSHIAVSKMRCQPKKLPMIGKFY